MVVPESEVAWWDLTAAALGPQRAFRVVVVGEDKVLKSGAAFLKASAPRAAAREFNGMGYRLQMLIKIGVAAHVPTDFYVTFDCDVALAKPLKPGMLVKEDEGGARGEGGRGRMRGIMQGEMRGPHASRWMSHSTDMFFGVDVGSARGREGRCTVEYLLRTMGVTPAVMSKRAALAVISKLQDIAAAAKRGSFIATQSWDAYLMSALETGADWTEYGLYAAGTCLAGLLEEVHVHDPNVRLYDPELQEDGSAYTDQQRMARAFDPEGKDLFVVLQSIGGSNAVEAAAAMYAHVKPVQ